MFSVLKNLFFFLLLFFLNFLFLCSIWPHLILISILTVDRIINVIFIDQYLYYHFIFSKVYKKKKKQKLGKISTKYTLFNTKKFGFQICKNTKNSLVKFFRSFILCRSEVFLDIKKAVEGGGGQN